MTELLLQIYMHSELSGACRRILLAINNWFCNCKHRRWIKPWDGQGRLLLSLYGRGREGGSELGVFGICGFKKGILKARNVLTLCMDFIFKPTV